MNNGCKFTWLFCAATKYKFLAKKLNKDCYNLNPDEQNDSVVAVEQNGRCSNVLRNQGSLRQVSSNASAFSPVSRLRDRMV